MVVEQNFVEQDVVEDKQGTDFFGEHLFSLLHHVRDTRYDKGVSTMSVELRPGESQESLLKRFRKSVAEARILPIVRQKRWFTSKSEVRRIKRQKAIRKARHTPRFGK